MKLSFVLLAVLLGVVSCDFSATDGVFKRSEGTMNIATNLMLKWTVMENDEVTFEFSAPTTGWLGFGLRTSAGMAGADFFYSNGQTVVDSTGVETGNPTTDTTNNVSDATVTTSGDVKTIKFTRMLNTGDNSDVTIGIGSAINAIYAYGTDASIDMTANNVMSGNFTFTPEEASWSNQTKTLQTGRIVTHRAYTMNNTKYFVMEFTAPAPGWLGIGFGVSNTMAGSDVVYYSAPTADGDLTLTDAHNDSNGPPTTDSTQNVNLLYYTTNGSSTSTVRFYRKFDTGDADDDFVIPDSGSMNMIWACSGSKVLAKHADSNRGSFTFDIQEESGDHASIGMVVSYMAAFFISALFFFH